MTKFYAQEKQVFDINKVSVVGSPTITSDGIASEFTVDNYIVTAQTIDLSNANRWEILTPVFNINALTSLNGIMTTAVNKDGIIDIFIRTNGQVAWGVSDVFARRNPKANIKANINYQLKIEFTGANYNLYLSTNGSAFNLIDTYASTQKTALNSTLITGMRLGSPLNGSIDLTAFKIYVDNELIYSPTKPTYFLERRKEGFDRSKFTVVGSPTITEYGVASGFSASDYLKILLTVPSDSKWEIQGKLPQDLSQNGTLFGFSNNQYSKLYISNMRLYNTIIGYKTANDTVVKTIDCNMALTQEMAGKSFKYGFNGSHLYLEVEGTNPILVAMYSMVSDLTFVSIGTNNNQTSIYTSSINLPSISITVDGKEVFTGAKEKFYAMRGGK